jgi:argininosuccinate synthase
VRDYVFPMFRANALYEGTYLLGTSIARPLIAKRQIEIAQETGADAVAHGATGKGNDQVRFELGYYALKPDIKIIAPWREWDLTSRTKLIDYAEKHQIPVPKDKRGEAALQPGRQPAAHLLRRERAGGPVGRAGHGQRPLPHGHPDERARPAEEITIDFEAGDPSPSTARRCRPRPC